MEGQWSNTSSDGSQWEFEKWYWLSKCDTKSVATQDIQRPLQKSAIIRKPLEDQNHVKNLNKERIFNLLPIMEETNIKKKYARSKIEGQLLVHLLKGDVRELTSDLHKRQVVEFY